MFFNIITKLTRFYKINSYIYPKYLSIQKGEHTYHNRNNIINSNQILSNKNKETDPVSIFSWNIQELFYYTNPEKLNNVIYYLENCNSDILCLQEVFEENSLNRIVTNKIINDNYEYMLTGNLSTKYIVGENSGLCVLSKYPIEYKYSCPLKKLTCPDLMAKKEILYFSVGNINFATSHLQSENLEISKLQMEQIIECAPFEKFIIVGDMNNNFAELYMHSHCNNIVPTHDSGRILDYIIPYGNCYNIVINVDTNIPKNTSDHFPIYGQII